ncbi:MAG TPA: cyclopropane-fatty-acyl-phospholipid synthase family protein [Patescibacteria group bacterium]|nr:cyclopropane-fatty-acyl-phospholipid synthase family protein [Patescibacteria group bacterium]
MMLFIPFLRKLLRYGRLTVVDAWGGSHVFDGAAVASLAPVTIRLRDPRLHWRLAVQPSMAVGEAYMDGTLTVEQGSLYDFLALVTENIQRADNRYGPQERWSHLIRRLQQWNPIALARRNVAHHYDLSEEFYGLFLDTDRQYSCAYFSEPGITLDQAQAAKKRHIMAKLLLRPGQTVLDIGCGWGGLALSLARDADCQVTAVTLSEQQLRIARRRADEAQLSHKVRFLLCDYREIAGRFDRIVSVGMFEHVGVSHYHTFFRRLHDLLDDNGVALLHSIGRSTGSGATNPWIRKYIFPGGYSPALSDVLPAVEASGLMISDIEILRPHYALTLRQWRARFAERRTQAAALYDERFCRMWEFYLAGAETAFRHQGHMVFQMQLTRSTDAVPPTRDYIGAAEKSYPQS